MSKMRHFVRKKPKKPKRTKDTFYRSKEWKELRFKKLREVQYCECCGKSKKDVLESGEKVKLTVDHIKCRSKYPELALDYNNLQVLCQACNEGKSNLYEDDFRTQEIEYTDDHY